MQNPFKHRGEPVILASLLAADWGILAQEAQEALAAGADGLHLDIMDYHYVPNLSMSPALCTALRKRLPQAWIDVHLMVENVDPLIQESAAAGAQSISFHPDASMDPRRSLSLIQEKGCLAGLALSPGACLDFLSSVIDVLDYLLILSVRPGFGGQSFLPEVLDRVSVVYGLLERLRGRIPIIMDGGINPSTRAMATAADVPMFVAGHAIFSQASYQQAIEALKGRAGA